MNSAWLTVVAAGLGTIALKAFGPVLLGGRTLPRAASGVLALLAPALLAALIATNTFGGNHRLVVDARAAGVLVAAAAIALRAPLLLTLLLAAAVTAGLRLALG